MSKSCRNTFLSDVVLGKYVQGFVVFLSQRVNDSPSRQATAPCTCKAWQLHRAWTKAHWVAVCKFGTLPLSLTLEILLHIFRKSYRKLKRWHLPMTPCKESGILRNLALPFMLQCYHWRHPGPRLASWVKIPRRPGQRLRWRQVKWKLWRWNGGETKPGRIQPCAKQLKPMDVTLPP